ncbi:MAG TPA: ferredoxin [Elusimicrobia bacterium]|nr:ferredoxin [Elusimicrobiota bacterium]
MPWIKENDCTGCGVCVRKCPAEAIVLTSARKAKIDMLKCARCGVCHEVCPRHAVGHDSELVPSLVSANIADAEKKTALCGERLGAPERENSLDRFIKHYRREIAVAEKTIEGLMKLKGGKA